MDGSSAPPSSSDRTAMPENAKESAGADEDMLEEKRSPGKPDDEPLSQEKVAAEGSIQLPKFLGSVVRAASSTAQQAATGCGCAANGPPENAANDITISITPTTGGQFDLTVDRSESVENLKKSISRKLKVAKERICLLHRERLLRDGTLEENRLQDGSRLTLLPSVETGLLTQRPEQSVMQALESLNDSQVNDFLSGKAPLNLTMRLGDHMMLIQLQLSTVTPTSPTSPTPSQSSSSNTDLNIGVNPSTGTNMPSALSNLLQSRRFERAARSSSSTSKIQSGSSRTASMISSLVSAIHATANCSTSLSTATTTTSPVCSSRATTASSVSSSSYSQIGSGFCNGQAQQSTRPGHTCSSASSPSSASSSSSSPSPSPPSATGNFACQSCLLFHLPSHHHHSYNHHHHHHHSRNKAAGAAGAAPAAGAAEAAGAAALAAAVLASCMPGNCNNPAATSSPGSTSADQQPQSTSEAPLDAPPTKKKLWTVHHHHHHSRNKGAGAAALAAAVVASCMPGNNNNPAATSSPGTTNADHQPQSTSEAPLDAPPAKKKLCTFQNHYQHWKNKRAAATALAAAVVASSSTSGSSNSPAATSSPGSTNADHQPQSTSEAPVDAPPPKRKLCTVHHHQSNGTEGSRSTSAEEARPQSPGASSSMEQSSKTASLDTRALVEASRNLTQKLKQLSSEENVRRRHGAIIESMHHHGKGVYSGTFSGTLKPALQDRHGRPKRDISTIIHILNDLLCATPAANVGHYRHHHRHSSSRQHSLTSSTATSTTGSSANLGCHDSNGSGYSTEELSKENEATKGKMRRLRLVMEQRRAQRRARQARQARAAPYTTQWAAVTPDPDPNHDPNTSATSATSATANPAEAQTEPELQPCSPKPVVA